MQKVAHPPFALQLSYQKSPLTNLILKSASRPLLLSKYVQGL